MRLTESDVKAMGEEDLYEALTLITAEIKVRKEGGFAETVREYLRTGADGALWSLIEKGGGAVKLSFETDHWDDGWFYDEARGDLTLANGHAVEVDFSETVVADALRELSGVRRREYGLNRSSALVVDMVTGAVEHD